MQLNPYLHFNGDCETAFKFYQQVLGGEIEMMMPHAGTPGAEHVPAEWQQKIMHARLVTRGGALMGSDVPPQYQQSVQGFSVSVMIESVAEAERIFAALAEGGTVKMPISETFWSARFGMCIDRFGIPWMINCDAAA